MCKGFTDINMFYSGYKINKVFKLLLVLIPIWCNFFTILNIYVNNRTNLHYCNGIIQAGSIALFQETEKNSCSKKNIPVKPRFLSSIFFIRFILMHSLSKFSNRWDRVEGGTLLNTENSVKDAKFWHFFWFQKEFKLIVKGKKIDSF